MLSKILMLSILSICPVVIKVINVINMSSCRQTISREVLVDKLKVQHGKCDNHLRLSYNRLTNQGSGRCHCYVFGASHQLWDLPLATNGNWVFLPKYSFSSLFRPDRMELIANQYILRVVMTRGFAW